MPLLTIFNTEMEVFEKVDFLQEKLAKIDSNQNLGLVPTMGALHQGHLSLIERAKKDNEFVLATIFVNPTQFDKADDLINYPKDLDRDLSLLEKAGCNYVFVPSVQEVYGENVVAEDYDFGPMDKVMEGRYRSGHFDGVATIVHRLFEIAKPNRAYFGEKDYQQLAIIKAMVRQRSMSVEIVPCPILRETDGLAMSSRNVRLDDRQRQATPFIYQNLEAAKVLFEAGQDLDSIRKAVQLGFDQNPLLELEYFEIADQDQLLPQKTWDGQSKIRAFIAVFAGQVRLIDNIALN